MGSCRRGPASPPEGSDARGPEVTGPRLPFPGPLRTVRVRRVPAEGHQRARCHPREGLGGGLVSGPEHVTKLGATTHLENTGRPLLPSRQALPSDRRPSVLWNGLAFRDPNRAVMGFSDARYTCLAVLPLGGPGGRLLCREIWEPETAAHRPPTVLSGLALAPGTLPVSLSS